MIIIIIFDKVIIGFYFNKIYVYYGEIFYIIFVDFSHISHI